MKKIVTVIATISVIWASGCAETAKNTQTEQPALSPTKVTQEPQLYTAYNIWRIRSHNMKCINYKYGNNILPAGTRVTKVKIKWDNNLKKDMISFTTVHDNRNYNIYFTKNWVNNDFTIYLKSIFFAFLKFSWFYNTLFKL